MKAFIQALVRRAGYEVLRKKPGLVEFLDRRKIATVVDVGANEGQFGFWLRARGYRGRIVSFEPTSAAFDVLKSRAAKDKKWEVNRLALGAQSGQATIHLSGYSEFNSLQQVTSAATRFDPRSAAIHHEQIEVCTFDELRIEDLPRTLLKIDTQGFEKQVLTGAAQCLPMLCAVQLELPIVHLYKDTWRISEALEYMRAQGFVLSQMHPVNFSSVDPVSLVEVDALFRRYDENIDA